MLNPDTSICASLNATWTARAKSDRSVVSSSTKSLSAIRFGIVISPLVVGGLRFADRSALERACLELRVELGLEHLARRHLHERDRAGHLVAGHMNAPTRHSHPIM